MSPLHVVLFEPEIAPNTGNIIRLCANTGCALHLIEPLGFEMDDKKLRRAGLDYRELVQVYPHANLSACRLALADLGWSQRLFACTTKGESRFSQVVFQHGDALLFGPESRGLPAALLAELDADRRLRIPMRAESRSLNLSNAVALVVFEALRQLDYPELV